MGLGLIEKLANLAWDQHAGSLTDLDLEDFPRFHSAIARSMLHHLRLIYFTPSQTRDARFAGPGVHHGDAGRRLLAGQDRARPSPTRLPARWPTRPTWPQFSEVYYPDDCSLRDVWETIVTTGRRLNGFSKCGGTASAAMADGRCSGTI
jgi:hypothetical protein